MVDSKANEIYILMKELIINKELKPGMQLKEQELSTRFNSSRTPIRQAFKKLEDEGFVEIVPNKGTYIVDPSINDICYAYELRVKLEEVLSEEIIEKVTPEAIEGLEHYIKLEPKFYMDDKKLAYIENNKEFHLKIAQLSDNPYLIDAIEQILDVINIHLIFYDNFDPIGLQDVNSIKEHELIIKYLKEKNLSKLKETMIQHVKSTCQKLKNNKENASKKVPYSLL